MSSTLVTISIDTPKSKAKDLQSHVFLDGSQPELWMVQYPARQLMQVRCVFSMHWRQLKSHSKQLRSIRHCHLISPTRQVYTLSRPGSDVTKDPSMISVVLVIATKWHPLQCPVKSFPQQYGKQDFVPLLALLRPIIRVAAP